MLILKSLINIYKLIRPFILIIINKTLNLNFYQEDAFLTSFYLVGILTDTAITQKGSSLSFWLKADQQEQEEK